MRTASGLVVLAILARGLGSGAEASPATSPAALVWYEPGGEERLRIDLRALPPRTEEAGVALRAPVWNPRLPDGSISLLDGGSFDLAAAGGSVLVLDFWASWCTPCRQELPHLEGLHRELEASGLRAIAINVSEEPDVARDFARALGLTMPIGRYDDDMSATLFRQALPTIVVADRFGAIRRRFDGYRVGDEREISGLVRELLAETHPPERTVADVDTGSGVFRVVWARDPPTAIDGLAVTGSGSGGVLVSLWRGITHFGVDGRTVREWPSSRSRGELRGSASTATALAFRPGNAEATLLPEDGADPEPISASGELLDASPLGADRWVLGTTRGVDVLPSGVHASTTVGPVASVAQVGVEGGSGIVAVTRDGRLLRIDPSLGKVRESVDVAPGTRVVGGGDADPGYGVVPAAVGSAVVGKFLPQGRAGIAIALEGQLLVLDLATGGVTFRARWPELRHLAAGDVDGDGLDDLAVAASRRVSVLSSAHGAKPAMSDVPEREGAP